MIELIDYMSWLIIELIELCLWLSLSHVLSMPVCHVIISRALIEWYIGELYRILLYRYH